MLYIIFVLKCKVTTHIEVSKYTLQGEGDQVLDTGKYVVIWKQEDGQWKLHCDIFNSSMPAPA
jgi:ketosteroid isomerase-like protein